VASNTYRALPDGFYLVGDSANPQPEFQRAIIDKVRTVTQIAPLAGAYTRPLLTST